MLLFFSKYISLPLLLLLENDTIGTNIQWYMLLRPVTISISRHKDGVPRQQTFSFKFGDGTVIDSDSVPRPTGPPTQQTPDKPGKYHRISLIDTAY